MTTHPGNCCRRLVTIALGPNGEVEITKQGDKSTGGRPSRISPEDEKNAIDDIKNNPDKWIPTGDPNGDGWIESKRAAEFCGDKLNEWEDNRLEIDEGAEGTA